MVKVIDIVIGVIVFAVAVGLISMVWVDIGTNYNVNVNDSYAEYFVKVNSTLAPMEDMAADMSEGASGEIGFGSLGQIGSLVISTMQLPLKAISSTATLITTTWDILNIPPELQWVFGAIISIITLVIVWALLSYFFGRTA